jgi:CMP-N-acetylneuraminic acid synthetase
VKKQILIFYKSVKVRLCNKPEIMFLKTLFKASFKNTHSDKKVSVTPLEVTMNIVTSWKNKRMKTVGKHKETRNTGQTLEDKWDECDNIYIMCPRVYS